MRKSSLLCFAMLLALGCSESNADKDGGSGGDGGGFGTDGGSRDGAAGGSAGSGGVAGRPATDGPVDPGPDPAQCGLSLTSDGVLDLDLHTVHVTGRVTMNGAPLPATTSSPTLRLVAEEGGGGGAFLDLERVRAAGGSYDVHVLAGRYRLLYDNPRCDDGAMPCQQAVVVNAAASLTMSGTFDIDLRTVRLSGNVTLNSAPLPAAAYRRGLIRVRGADQSIGQLVDLDATPTSYQARLLVGTYELLYDNTDFSCTGDPYPCQTLAPFRAGLAATSDGVLDLDIPTARLSGRTTLDGAALPPATYARGQIRVRGPGASTGRLIDLDQSPGTYGARLIRGVYDILYDNSDSSCTGAPYPCQTAAVLRRGVAAMSDGVLDLDIPTARLSGRVTLGSAALPAAPYSRGTLRVRGADASLGRLVDLDQLGAGGYDTRLVRGTYDLLYDNTDSSCTGTPYPCQRMTTFRTAVAIATDGVLDLDLPIAHLSGRVTLDRAALPPAAYSRGVLRVRSADGGTGNLVDLDQLTGNYSVVLLRGSYDLLYDNTDSSCTGAPYPCQQQTRLRDLPATQDGVLDIDLPTVHLTGRVTQDGAPLPTPPYDRGLIRLHGTQASLGTLITLDRMPQGNYDARILGGRYNLEYQQHDFSCDGSSVPCQSGILRGCGH